jgi:uncharacterized membrane protein YebE (DUF533 family)
MNIQSLLDQILRSANAGPGQTDLGKYATGAAAGGALGLLLGGRRRGALLRYGSAAALGAFAWNVYRDWQARQPTAAATGQSTAAPTAFAQLPAPAAQAHSWSMLKAMLSAARADGHIDERERGLVEVRLQGLDAEPALRARIDAELQRPVDPAEVAAGVDGPAQAAEVYLASLVVCDATSTMERAYLDALAGALCLPPELKGELERRAAAGG